MKFRELLEAAKITPIAVQGDATVLRLNEDSRQVQPDDLFLSLPSVSGNTQEYLQAAILAGASAVFTHTEEAFRLAQESGIAAAWIPTHRYEFNRALAALCKQGFNDPSSRLKLIGITGTNGKTSSAWFVSELLNRLGTPCAYLGTLGYRSPSSQVELSNTTPASPQLNRLLSQAVHEGCTALVMEVSSHALAEHRVDGFEFDVVTFTNLSQDHLDFHQTMEEYALAKKRLFLDRNFAGMKHLSRVLNVSDPVGRTWATELEALTFSTDNSDADIKAIRTASRIDQISFEVRIGVKTAHCQLPVGGDYSYWNATAAIASIFALNDPRLSVESVVASLSSVHPVPGRFEPVANEQGIGVIVDYAHTPDAIEKLLQAARPLTQGRLWIVFGCGGDRDRTKRPLMAGAAARNADLIVVTSDNPRTEDQEQIFNDIRAGFERKSNVSEITNRPEAINWAIHAASVGDVIVIAGKGHENYQIIGKQKFPMDDRKIAETALESRR